MRLNAMNLSLLLALVLLPGRAVSQTPAPTAVDYSLAVKDLGKFIQDRMGKDHVKGLSLALVDGDRTVWLTGFGMADEARRIPADGNTLYPLGGISRILTAAEILKLSGEGMLDLDKPLTDYLPDFSIHSRFQAAKDITVRSLLADHSGLPGFFLKGLWVRHPESLAAFVGELKKDYLAAPPQTLYKYSYVDYALLGRMVEVLRKEPFARAVKDDLLDPLGMEASGFGDMPSSPEAAKGYRDGKEMAPFRLRDVPAAGFFSSAADMAKYLRFLLGAGEGTGAPLKRRQIAEMFRTQYPGLPLDFGRKVGMGWMLSGISIPGTPETAWHSGEYPPFSSKIALLPGSRLGVAAFSNSAEGGGLVDDLAVRALKLMVEAKTGTKENLEKPKVRMPPTVKVGAGELDGYAGTYSALGQLSRFTREGDHLSADYEGHRLDLLPVSPETFIPHLVFLLFFPVDLPQFPITFERAGGEQVALLGGLPFPVPFQKIRPVEIPSAWKAREGDYELVNPDGQVDFDRISLGERDGFLSVDLKVSLQAFDIHHQEFKVALLPLSDSDAVVPGLFYGDGGTLHTVEEKGKTRVFYSGYWFQRMQTPSGN
jgi:CubicO group peptidase (beta-lactamase class C family)